MAPASRQKPGLSKLYLSIVGGTKMLLFTLWLVHSRFGSFIIHFSVYLYSKCQPQSIMGLYSVAFVKIED